MSRRGAQAPIQVICCDSTQFLYYNGVGEKGAAVEPFEYQGMKLDVWTQSGTVLSTSRHSRTSVSSHGGGGWVGPNGGSVSAPTIVSSTTTEQEIWIRSDSGEETAVQLLDADVPVREGQRVTFIAAKQPTAAAGFWVTLVNHSANRHWPLSSNVEVSSKGKLGAYPLVKWRDLMIAGIIFWVAQGLPASVAHGSAALVLFLVLGLPVTYLVVRCWLRARNRDRIFAALDVWAERNAQAAYSAANASRAAAARTEKVA